MMWTNIRPSPWRSKRPSSNILTCWLQKQWLSGKQNLPLRSCSRKQSPDWSWQLPRWGDKRRSLQLWSPTPPCSTPPRGHSTPLCTHQHENRLRLTLQSVDLHSCPFRQTNCDQASRPPPGPSHLFMKWEVKSLHWINSPLRVMQD
ncbi:hypothetical protein INR49_016768 [Caranx melampygus]|nr:hypothetical protein INR49_016768 [Caranx melampygus]